MSTPRRTIILLVEDNSDLRTATLDLLRTLGYGVLVARDIGQALETAGSESVDLALINAYPADGSALAIVDALRAAAPHLPALLASGFGDDVELRRRVLAGNVGFLPIPFSPQALEEKISETLKQRPEPSGSVPEHRKQAPAAPSKSGRSDRGRIYLAAAAAIVTAGLVFQLSNSAPRMPELEPSETRRGYTIELLAPIGALDAPPTRLAWREAPSSVGYRVVLSTVDDTTIWQSETRKTSIDLPEEVITQLQTAVSYFWQVEGLGENSSHTGRSILVAFRFGTSEATF